MGRKYSILLGGVPGVGKSSISGYIARNLDIDIVLSGDYLREFSRGLLSKPDVDSIGVSVYDSWKLFGEKNRENIIRGFARQSEILAPGITRVLERSQKNGEYLILETLYFSPELVPKEILDQCIALYIYISDEEVHRNRLLERGKFTHTNSPGERLASHLPEYRTVMDRCVETSRKMGIKVFDNMDYGRTRDEIMKYVEEQVGTD